VREKRKRETERGWERQKEKRRERDRKKIIDREKRNFFRCECVHRTMEKFPNKLSTKFIIFIIQNK